MTLTECRNLTRLYSRLTTTSVATANVDLFINQNEIGLAMDLIEMNPSLAVKVEDVSWAAGTAYETLDNTFLPLSLGASDSVYKVVFVEDRSGDTKSLYSAANSMTELSGDGIVEQRSEGYATSLRWHYDGTRLWVYPVPTGTETLTIGVVLVPTVQTTAGDAMLEGFTNAGQLFAEGIAIRAAFDLRASLGYDLTWIAAKKSEFDDRLAKYSRSLQLQEADHIGNVRWNHYA